MFHSRLPIILQSEAAECGLASLAMIANFHGHRIDMTSLRLQFSLSLKGATLLDLMRMAETLTLSARGLRAEVEHLSSLQLPCILHWDLSHFVVLKEVKRNHILIHDPARGALKVPMAEVSRRFSGIVLEIEPAPMFQPIHKEAKTKLTQLWSRAAGLKRSLGQTIALSVMYQALVLATPLYLQLIVDRVIPSVDRDLLLLSTVGFMILCTFAVAMEALRSYVVLVLGQQMSFQLAGNVVARLLRLPAPFFEKRFVGDILSRVISIKQIQTAVTQGAPVVVVDVLVVILSALALLFYSPLIALLNALIFMAHIGVSYAVYVVRLRREEELAVATAEEQSHLIETIRASSTIKIFCREVEREFSWRSHFVRVANAALKVGTLEIVERSSQLLATGFTLILTVYVGARAILDNSMSLGSLFAILLLRTYLIDRGNAVVERAVSLMALRIHLRRLGDIIHTEPELPSSSFSAAEFKGSLELRGVGFRYASNEPAVLSSINLEIAPGQYVAIVGPSGGGKTTLLKILLGLYEPTEGQVLIDGRTLSSRGLHQWRSQIGVVQQDDELFAGTITDNITFFDNNPDFERAFDCARQARIYEDVERMPMGFLSLVGDMGSVLSGGQRQRILLARALYRQPKVLILDEGTANLDPKTEFEIGEVIQTMNIMRIVIAHRAELIRRADRVFALSGGTLAELAKDKVALDNC